MADQRLDDGALKEGYDKVESIKAYIDGHIARLEGDLSTIGDNWKGDAAAQFQQLMTQWHENADKLNNALQDLADNLRGTDASMAHTESDAQSSISAILAGM